ncbi:MAG: hypothetical protein P8X90_30655 [Desulfobacterales bacterium]
MADGNPEIALQAVFHENQVLQVKGLIQPESQAHFVDLLGGRPLAQHHYQWIPGSQMNHREYDDGHGDQYEYQMQQSFKKIAPHCESGPPAGCELG